MNNTFTILPSGVWGVRVVGTPQVGENVEIFKRSGARKTVRISRVLATTAGESVCEIEGTSKVRNARGLRRISVYRSRCEDAPCCGCC